MGSYEFSFLRPTPSEARDLAFSVRRNEQTATEGVPEAHLAVCGATPVASTLRCQGHHLSAFTAARCSVRVCSGTFAAMFSHTQTVLSFPPDASVPPEL